MAIIQRYGISYCTECGYPRDYCKGHKPDEPSKDDDGSKLAKRIADVRTKQGGR